MRGRPRFLERPGDARGRRVPRRRQSRIAPGGDRPSPGLARRALGQGGGPLALPAAHRAARSTRRPRPGLASGRSLTGPKRAIQPDRLAGARGCRPMKALVIERNVAAFRGRPGALEPGSGPLGGRRAAAAHRQRTPLASRSRVARRRAPAGRHLRFGPGHPRRTQLEILRGPGQFSFRPGPRSRGHRAHRRRCRRRHHPDRRQPGGARASVGLRRPGHRSPMRGLCARADRRLSARRSRPPPARSANRLLRGHRRRLVGCGTGRPPDPAPCCARRAAATRMR